MSEALENPRHSPSVPIFPIACWALGAVAFSQILIAGLALSKRLEDSRVVREVEKEVPKLVAVPMPAPVVPGLGESSVVARPPVTAAPELPPLPPEPLPMPEPSPVGAPEIANPRSERLVNEAREARVAGDMGRAIVKLNEAAAESPDDPQIHYELGLVHEQMEVFDTAAVHYEKVFQMGVSGAGSLYELAAAKLRDGFGQPVDMLGKLALGRVRIFNDPEYEKGQRAILTIPIQRSPTAEIDINEIEVGVLFFNRTSKGEIKQLDEEDKSWVTQRWISLPFDWAGGEENLRMTYIIPRQDSDTEDLFGKLGYYGQVVSLKYKGEVLDVQAWPRDLAARIPPTEQPQAAPAPRSDGVPDDLMLPQFENFAPPDMDPNVPLLPPAN